MADEHRRMEELVSALLDDELSPEERREALDLVRRNPEAAALYERLGSLASAMRQEVPPSPPEDLAERIGARIRETSGELVVPKRTRWFGPTALTAAASVAAALLIGALLHDQWESLAPRFGAGARDETQLTRRAADASKGAKGEDAPAAGSEAEAGAPAATMQHVAENDAPEGPDRQKRGAAVGEEAAEAERPSEPGTRERARPEAAQPSLPDAAGAPSRGRSRGETPRRKASDEAMSGQDVAAGPAEEGQLAAQEKGSVLPPGSALDFAATAGDDTADGADRGEKLNERPARRDRQATDSLRSIAAPAAPEERRDAGPACSRAWITSTRIGRVADAPEDSPARLRALVESIGGRIDEKEDPSLVLPTARLTDLLEGLEATGHALVGPRPVVPEGHDCVELRLLPSR